MDYESLLGLLKQRRSIRAFKTDPIEDAKVKKIVESVRWAPSGMNTQPWEIVVVRDPKLKDSIVKFIEEALKEMMKKMPPRPYSPLAFASAPVFLLFLGDTRIRHFMPPMDEQRWSNISISNMALGFHNMLLAATTLGLGAQWMSVAGHPVVAKQIKGLLDIPDFLETYAMMALGYPDAKPMPKDMRETRDMVHYDLCTPSDFRTEDDLKKFFKR